MLALEPAAIDLGYGTPDIFFHRDRRPEISVMGFTGTPPVVLGPTGFPGIHALVVLAVGLIVVVVHVVFFLWLWGRIIRPDDRGDRALADRHRTSADRERISRRADFLQRFRQA